jgi:heme/copper-type cytochrome/quinol oxidase subunit 2
MQTSLVLLITLAVVVCLVLLAVETVREFRRMDRRPSDFEGSDRLAGSAE